MGFLSRMLGKGPDAAVQLPRTTPATAQRIKNILSIRQLESMPAQAARAFQLATDPKATAADFVKVIEADEVLSARIVRVANSVYFFRGTPATDIAKAVGNIGLDELRCLISSTMLRSLLQGRHKAREQVWANGVAVGICCRTLSRYTNASTGEAFLCGLLHDVGKLVMIRRGGTDYDQVLRKVSGGQKNFLEAEEEVFGVSHTEVGKWVAENWNFPPAAILAISEHHESWPKDERLHGKGTPLPMLVKAGDIIAHSLGLGHTPLMRPFQNANREQLQEAFQQLGIAETDRESFLTNFKKQFDQESGLYQMEELHGS